MKTTNSLLLGLTLGASVLADRSAIAALYTFTGPDGNGTYSSGASSLNQKILDNSPEEGVGYGFNFAATGLSISTLTLTLNMSGGMNGDMYGYLQHGGTLIELFNPGSFSAGGAGGSVLNLTLSSASSTSLSGATASQLSSGLTYAALGDLNGFVTADPNGLWTLYFADKSPGDEMTLNSFNLSITAVPEPISVALGIFGAGLIGMVAVRKFRTNRAARVAVC